MALAFTDQSIKRNTRGRDYDQGGGEKTIKSAWYEEEM